MKNRTLLLINIIILLFTTSEIYAEKDLQTILNSINPGTTIYIGANTFTSEVAYTLENKYNITIVFDDSCDIFCSSKYQNVIEIKNCYNVKIFNGKFKHIVARNENCIGSVFYITSSNTISLINCDINGSGARGVYANCVGNFSLINCYLHDNSIAAFYMDLLCKNVKLINNTYNNNGATGKEKFDPKPDYQADKIHDTEINERILMPEEKRNNDSIRKIHELYFNNIDSTGFTSLDVNQQKIYTYSTNAQIKQSDLNSAVFPTELIHFENGYSSSLWLNPPFYVKKFYQAKSGLTSFDFRSSYELTKLSAEQINMITPTAFVSSINANELYIGEHETTKLPFNPIPELRSISDSIRGMNALIIASNRDNFIAKLQKVRNNYLIANTQYKNTKFIIKGNAYFDISNYDINNKILYIHLSLSYMNSRFGNIEGIYVATLAVSVPLNEATQLFIPDEKFYVPVFFSVKPGSFRKGLGIAGGGASCWEVPNMIIVEEPQITVFTKNNYVCRFNTVGIKGEMWPSGLNTERWDLHKIDLPRNEYKRYINGVFFKQ
jgi:hypothetical protein